MDLNSQLFTTDTEMNNYLITSCPLTSKITSVAQTYLAGGLWMQAREYLSSFRLLNCKVANQSISD